MPHLDVSVLTTPSHFGIAGQEQNKDQILHRIASIPTLLIHNIVSYRLRRVCECVDKQVIVIGIMYAHNPVLKVLPTVTNVSSVVLIGEGKGLSSTELCVIK